MNGIFGKEVLDSVFERGKNKKGFILIMRD